MSDQEPCPPEETFDALMRGGLTGDERTSFHAHVDRCRSCQLLLRELAGLIDVEAVLTGTCTSDYRLQARVGQGGMGVVYRAADVQLGRTVALKLPPRPEPDMDGIAEGSTAVSVDPARPAQPAQPSRPAQPARDEARFMREALITARLQHPGIVPIHQIGRWPTGEAFYTMKLISGRSLRELLDGARSLEERLALLPQVLAAADAVGYAHAQGVIHRDLKPANIMSGPFGETVVIDWGLAKQLDVDEPLTDLEADIDQRDLSLTSPGLVLGTPSYMAPEQARGDAVDARADVFALGAILYHLLAGVAPALSSRAAMTWPPGAPVDLIALVGKATAIDPRDRYPTANELADDLRRFHTGQLVRARAYSASTLLWRWLVRHRSLVILAVLSVGILLSSEVIAVRRIMRERHAAVASRNDLVVLQAGTALAKDPTAALAWLKLADGPTVDDTAIRSIAEDALSRGVARHVLRGHDGPVDNIAVDPAGKLLASAGKDGVVRLWDRATGQARAALPHPDVTGIAFSADGAVLASSGRSGLIQLYWPATGRRRALRDHTGAVTALALRPEGDLVAGGADGTVRIASIDSGALRTLGSHQGAVNAIAVSPRGDLIASAGADGGITLWTLTTGQSRVLQGHHGEVLAIDFRSDGQALVSGGADSTVRIWSVTTGEARMLRGPSRMVHDVKFSPDSSMIASAGMDPAVWLWDATTGDGRKLAWDQAPWVIAFSPDGDRVAGAGLGGGVRLWDLPGQYSWDLRGHEGAIYDVAFAEDGTLASAGEDGSIRLWENTNVSGTRLNITTEVHQFTMSRDGSLLAYGRMRTDPSVRLLPLDAGAERLLSPWHRMIHRVVLSAEGRWLAATGTDDRTIGLWDLRTGEHKQLLGHDEPVEDLAFAPDGAVLASAGLDGTVRLWNPATGEARTLRGHVGWVYSVAFSRDGMLVSGGRDGTVRRWDLAAGTSHVLLQHPGQVRIVAFSPDGKFLASGDLASGVGILEVATARGRIVRAHRAWVFSVAFSPDGRSLASGSADGTVRLWSVPSGTSRVLTRHDATVRSVAFAPDGKSVASSSHDTTIRLASVESGATRVLRGHDSKVVRARFTPDGKRLISGDEDGNLITWSVPALTVTATPTTPAGLAAWLARLTSAAIQRDHRAATPAHDAILIPHGRSTEPQW